MGVNSDLLGEGSIETTKNRICQRMDGDCIRGFDTWAGRSTRGF